MPLNPEILFLLSVYVALTLRMLLPWDDTRSPKVPWEILGCSALAAIGTLLVGLRMRLSDPIEWIVAFAIILVMAAALGFRDHFYPKLTEGMLLVNTLVFWYASASIVPTLNPRSELVFPVAVTFFALGTCLVLHASFSRTKNSPTMRFLLIFWNLLTSLILSILVFATVLTNDVSWVTYVLLGPIVVQGVVSLTPFLMMRRAKGETREDVMKEAFFYANRLRRNQLDGMHALGIIIILGAVFVANHELQLIHPLTVIGLIEIGSTWRISST